LFLNAALRLDSSCDLILSKFLSQPLVAWLICRFALLPFRTGACKEQGGQAEAYGSLYVNKGAHINYDVHAKDLEGAGKPELRPHVCDGSSEPAGRALRAQH
jgi:hypothetical protein